MPVVTNIFLISVGTIASKINVTPKYVYSPISKLHSIFSVTNLLAHNNKSQICYCGQISLQSAAVNCSFSDTFVGNIYFAGDGTWLLAHYNDLKFKSSFFLIFRTRYFRDTSEPLY